MQYLIDSKRYVENVMNYSCDVFISAYNMSERVTRIFDSVQSNEKRWWIIPEYQFDADDIFGLQDPDILPYFKESDLVLAGMGLIKTDITSDCRICIDITGLMRSHILFILKYLQRRGVSKFDALYTEPTHYSRKAETTFSEKISGVRQVEGFDGFHQSDGPNDVLLMGVGYDDEPMARVKLSKEQCRLVQLHSLPSLSLDMYHESLLRLNKISDVSRNDDDAALFSSANDPFVVAQTLSDAWHDMNARRKISNLYLCPLATKVQALGFGLFYLRELSDAPASIILPTVDVYSKQTSSGVGRTWVYSIEF